MTMRLPDVCRHVALLALLPLLDACAFHPIDAANRQAADVQQQVAALGPACTVGNARRPERDWAMAPLTFTHPAKGDAHGTLYPLTAPVSTRAVRIALNAKALRELDKLEVRDADGNWTVIGAGQEAPQACDYVWLEQAVGPAARQVAALRLTFHWNLGLVASANPGVLREAARNKGG